MRKLVITLSLLAVFVVACTSGGSTADERREGANDEPRPTVGAPTSVVEPTANPEPTAQPSSEGGALEGVLNPLSLLSAPVFSASGPANLPAAAGEADPSLKAALLTLDDLPPGYDVLPPGEMSFSFDTDEGSMSMAMSMFSQGAMLDSFPESMVISGVITGSGDLLDESLAELRRAVCAPE